MTPDTFQTDSLDLAAVLAAHGKQPDVTQSISQITATFSFKRDPELLRLVEEFASGSLMVNAAVLLRARKWLFHQIKAVRP